MPRMTLAELENLMDTHFTGWRTFSNIVSLGENDVTVKMPFRKELMRAGGTISGPALMTLADTAAYFVTLAHAGPHPGAATANLRAPVVVNPVAARARQVVLADGTHPIRRPLRR